MTKQPSIYADVKSDLLRRGETLFPFTCFDERVDWEGVSHVLDVLWGQGDRLMTLEEILRLYD